MGARSAVWRNAAPRRPPGCPTALARWPPSAPCPARAGGGRSASSGSALARSAALRPVPALAAGAPGPLPRDGVCPRRRPGGRAGPWPRRGDATRATRASRAPGWPLHTPSPRSWRALESCCDPPRRARPRRALRHPGTARRGASRAGRGGQARRRRWLPAHTPPGPRRAQRGAERPDRAARSSSGGRRAGAGTLPAAHTPPALQPLGSVHTGAGPPGGARSLGGRPGLPAPARPWRGRRLGTRQRLWARGQTPPAGRLAPPGLCPGRGRPGGWGRMGVRPGRATLPPAARLGPGPGRQPEAGGRGPRLPDPGALVGLPSTGRGVVWWPPPPRPGRYAHRRRPPARRGRRAGVPAPVSRRGHPPRRSHGPVPGRHGAGTRAGGTWRRRRPKARPRRAGEPRLQRPAARRQAVARPGGPWASARRHPGPAHRVMAHRGRGAAPAAAAPGRSGPGVARARRPALSQAPRDPPLGCPRPRRRPRPATPPFPRPPGPVSRPPAEGPSGAACRARHRVRSPCSPHAAVRAPATGARAAALQAVAGALPPGRGGCPHAGGAAPAAAPSWAPHRGLERPRRPRGGGAGPGRCRALRGLLLGGERPPARAPPPVHPGSACPAAHPARRSPGSAPRPTRSAPGARPPTASSPRHRGGAPSWRRTKTRRRRPRGGAAWRPLAPPSRAPGARRRLRRGPHRHRPQRGPRWPTGPDAWPARRRGGALGPRRAAGGWRACPSAHPARRAAGPGPPGCPDARGSRHALARGSTRKPTASWWAAGAWGTPPGRPHGARPPASRAPRCSVPGPVRGATPGLPHSALDVAPRHAPTLPRPRGFSATSAALALLPRLAPRCHGLRRRSAPGAIMLPSTRACTAWPPLCNHARPLPAALRDRRRHPAETVMRAGQRVRRHGQIEQETALQPVSPDVHVRLRRRLASPCASRIAQPHCQTAVSPTCSRSR